MFVVTYQLFQLPDAKLHVFYEILEARGHPLTEITEVAALR